MEFPGRWDLFQMEEFTIAYPRNPGEAGLEVMVQARDNGRLIDHVCVTLHGSLMLKVSVPIGAIFIAADQPAWTLSWDLWPRDIIMRRNMASSAWVDVLTAIQANEIEVTDDKGPIPKEKIEAFFKQGKDKLVLHAAIRWAAGIGEDQRMILILQGLPASASQLEGNPIFKG